jgi:DNA-binding NarL/FixJ family response regulator
MIRILVVDDHPILREGLVAVLEDQQDFSVVEVAGLAAEGARLASETKPDIVLLDLEMPDSRGSESVAAVRAASPETNVLVFTAYDTDDLVVGALRAGAKGYLLKGASVSELGQAIRSVAAGQTYLSPRVAATLVAQLDTRGTSPILSPRELEVLRLVAQGHSNKQAAHQLSISEATIKFHVTSILTKLGADNRAQAVRIASQQGLI